MQRDTMPIAVMRWTVAVALLLGGLAYLGYRSGSHAPIDSVAEASERFGVPLRATMVAVNGVQLHVVEAGESSQPLVVLLHGYPEFWWGWKEQIARLARAGFHVVAPDQRGYNASSKPRAVSAYRARELVADVAGLIDAFGGKALLAGHDWGGFVAWRTALAHPEKVRRLIVFNAGHPRAHDDLAAQADSSESTGWYRKFFQLPVVPEVSTRFGNWYMLVNSLRESARAEVFSDQELEHYRYAWDRDGAMRTMINWYRAGFRHPDPLDGGDEVTMPTLIVWGLKDRFLPSPLAALSAKYCTDASILEIPEAGHWVLHEEPERTSAAMIEFFGKE